MAYFSEIGGKIRRERKRLGLTQKQLAGLLNTTHSYIGQIERGERNPKIETIKKISDALGVNILDEQKDEDKRMIKTKTEKKKGKGVISVKIEGDISTIVTEVCHTLARGVEALAEKVGDTQVESTLYATIQMAIRHLEEDGHKIDRNRLGLALMEE